MWTVRVYSSSTSMTTSRKTWTHNWSETLLGFLLFHVCQWEKERTLCSMSARDSIYFNFSRLLACTVFFFTWNSLFAFLFLVHSKFSFLDFANFYSQKNLATLYLKVFMYNVDELKKCYWIKRNYWFRFSKSFEYLPCSIYICDSTQMRVFLSGENSQSLRKQESIV